MSYYVSVEPPRKIHFSKKEIQDLLVSMLVITFAFAFALSGYGLMYIDWALFPTALLISVFAVATGFILHELGHKFVANKYGAWAEFRAWPQGLMMALIFALMVGVVWAAPGAVYIGGNITREQNGKISLAGPINNLIFATIFFPLIFIAKGIYFDIVFYVYFINAFLAVFNLLPIMPLDGAKVANWNIPVYILFLAVSIALLVPGFIL